MIIGIIQGGLGNQLFCFSALKKFAEIRKRRLVFAEISYGFARNKAWSSSYSVGSICNDRITKIQLLGWVYLLLRLLSTVKIGKYTIVAVINEENFFSPPLSLIYVLDGYFQEVRFVSDLDLSTNRQKKLLTLHLRFYLPNDIHLSASEVDEHSINLIRKSILISEKKKLELNIVTDDKERVCGYQDKVDRKLNVISNSEKGDFSLIASSSCLIFSGSTFSWWAAREVMKGGGEVLFDSFFLEGRNLESYIYKEWKRI